MCPSGTEMHELDYMTTKTQECERAHVLVVQRHMNTKTQECECVCALMLKMHRSVSMHATWWYRCIGVEYKDKRV